MASSYPPRVGTVHGDRFQLRELLGGGGVGQVFRAWDVQAQRVVVVKIFNPSRCHSETWEAYTRVIATAAPLRHPDLILPLTPPGPFTDQPTVVLESLTGEDLATLRSRMGRVPWAKALEIGSRCAEILHAVHRGCAIAHRDLKPANVFLTTSGAVKILDFGVAEFDVQSTERTRVDTALGVVDYKAPEQLESSDSGPRADMFALAVLMFEMIAGDRPFVGPSYFEVARKLLLQPAPAIAEVASGLDVPPGVDALLQRALQKRPEDRFDDLEAMHHACVDVLNQGTGSSPAIRRPRGARPASIPPGRGKPAVAGEEDDATLLASPRRPRSRESSQVRATPTARPSPGRRVVATGERAVITSGEPAPEVTLSDRTVVGVAPEAAPANADRTVVLADPRLAPRYSGADEDDEDDDELLQTRVHTRDDEGPPEHTMILRDGVSPPARGDATLIIRDDGTPPATLMLPDDSAAATGPGTLMLPAEDARDGGTMMISNTPSVRAKWTLQRTLIVVNVACGVLILLGLLLLVLSCGAPLAPGR